MLFWISPLRNALLLGALSACFILATLAFTLIGNAGKATSPAQRLATASPQIDPDAAAIFAMRRHRLDTTATPVRAPSLKEILDSAVVLVQAGVLPPPDWWPLSEVASAAVTPTSTPEPPPPPTPAPVQRRSVAPPPPTRPAPPPPPASPPAAPAAQAGAPAQAAAAAPAAVSSPAAPPPAPPPTSDSAYIDAAFTQAVWDAVNAVRSRAGLPPLASDGSLTAAAHDYALDLAGWRTFSHTGADGSTLGSRLSAFGITNVAAGEVLAMGWGDWSPSGVAQAWLDSPPHRSIILGKFTRAGVACAVSHEDGAKVTRCVMELAA